MSNIHSSATSGITSLCGGGGSDTFQNTSTKGSSSIVPKTIVQDFSDSGDRISLMDTWFNGFRNISNEYTKVEDIQGVGPGNPIVGKRIYRKELGGGEYVDMEIYGNRIGEITLDKIKNKDSIVFIFRN